MEDAPTPSRHKLKYDDKAAKYLLQSSTALDSTLNLIDLCTGIAPLSGFYNYVSG